MCRFAYGPADATVSCFSKIPIGFTFLVPARLDSPRQGAVKRVCTLVLIRMSTNVMYCMRMMPSVLRRCWLGGRKGIRPVRNWVVRCWRGCLSGAMCRLAYGPADATATHCLLLDWIPDGFAFLVQAHLGSPGQGAIKWVCVCVCVCTLVLYYISTTNTAGSLTQVLSLSLLGWLLFRFLGKTWNCLGVLWFKLQKLLSTSVHSLNINSKVMQMGLTES